MKKIFKEYHQFTEEELEQLWKSCLFVFDTNTLLNMYRYSRETVDAYIQVLEELKTKNQLWLPYQVGYEFYENRIGVISEYEKSYDEILSIMNQTKKDIQIKYKNHPFLDLVSINEEIGKGLADVESKIKKQKETHPRWIEKDEVLEKLNSIFEGSIGNNYDEEKIIKIRQEGKERYEKKIPPGFKDNQKSEDKKYGDLILWNQIIDKAKDSKKSIILISGDVKEDWWLEKDGKKIMPLPQLKREILSKAGVDFHIYTADRFLEFYKSSKKIDQKAIKEVREIRELEEERVRSKFERYELMGREKDFEPRIFDRYLPDYIYSYEILQDLFRTSIKFDISPEQKEELEYENRKLCELRNKIVHGEIDRSSIHKFYRYIREMSFALEKIIQTQGDPILVHKLRECSDRLEHTNHVLRKYL